MLWNIITLFGEAKLWLILAISLLIIAFLKRDKKLAIDSSHIISLVIISGSITLFIKNLFKIPRPCEGLSFCPHGYSFPSGHTLLLFSVLSYLYFSKNKNTLLLTIFLIITLLVAISRIVLQVHRIEDVACGCFLGVFVGFIYSKQLSKYVMYLIKG